MLTRSLSRKAAAAALSLALAGLPMFAGGGNVAAQTTGPGVPADWPYDIKPIIVRDASKGVSSASIAIPRGHPKAAEIQAAFDKLVGASAKKTSTQNADPTTGQEPEADASCGEPDPSASWLRADSFSLQDGSGTPVANVAHQTLVQSAATGCGYGQQAYTRSFMPNQSSARVDFGYYYYASYYGYTGPTVGCYYGPLVYGCDYTATFNDYHDTHEQVTMAYLSETNRSAYFEDVHCQ